MPDFIITLRLRLVGRDGMKMEMETRIGCNGNGIKTTILQVGFIFNVNMMEGDIYILPIMHQTVSRYFKLGNADSPLWRSLDWTKETERWSEWQFRFHPRSPSMQL